MIKEKEKFASLFAEFILTMATEIPRVFIDSHPIYRKARLRGYRKQQIEAGLNNLASRRILKRSGRFYKITPEGKKWAEKYYGRYFRMQHGKWDGKWRVILFDIPTDKESQRQAFKKRLKNIGAYMVQKSVFAFPYPCQEEIGDLCPDLELN